MKPSTDLYDLIRSLDKQEKRYFRLFAGRQSSTGDKSYLLVFDYIERLASRHQPYDEVALRRQYAGQRFLEHLPSVKNYLYNLLLESLENYNSGRTPEDTLFANLRRLRILYNKNLLAQAAKLQRQSLKLAEAHGLLLLQLECYVWELRLLSARMEVRQLETFLTESAERQQAILKELGLQQELLAACNQLQLLECRLGAPRNAQETSLYQEIGEGYTRFERSLGGHLDSTLFYLQGRSLYLTALGRHAEACEARARAVALLEKDPSEPEYSPLRYLAALDHLLESQLLARDFQLFTDTLAKLERFHLPKAVQIPASLETQKFCIQTTHLLNYSTAQGKLTENRAEAESRRRHFEILAPELGPVETLRLHYAFFHFLFALGEFRTALFHLNQILNRPEQNLQRNLVDYGRMLLLITHFELGNIDLLEDGMIRNTHRYFSSRGQLDGIEAFFVKMLQVIIDMPSAAELLSGLEWARPRLDELAESPEARHFFQLFDLIAWVDSKLSGGSYAERYRLRWG